MTRPACFFFYPKIPTIKKKKSFLIQNKSKSIFSLTSNICSSKVTVRHNTALSHCSLSVAAEGIASNVVFAPFVSQVENFFCMGSPLAVFLALRGIRPGTSCQQDHIMPTTICRRLFNVFHPTDPVVSHERSGLRQRNAFLTKNGCCCCCCCCFLFFLFCLHTPGFFHPSWGSFSGKCASVE